MPILAFENITGYIPWQGSESCFALRVKGDSMIQAGILDGDLVVVKPQPTASPGEIVVALLGRKPRSSALPAGRACLAHARKPRPISQFLPMRRRF